MPLQASKTAIDFSRRISFGLITGVAMLAITVAAVVLWMAVRQNEVAAENTFRMVKGGIAERLDRLATTTLDYSLRDLAYDAILTDDEEWMYDNIGTVATGDGPMDMVVLIKPGDTGRFGWDKESDEAGRSSDMVDEAAIQSVLGLLDAQPPDGRAAVSTIARSGGEIWMLSAARVTPWDGVPEGAGDADLPRQVQGLLVGPELLGFIGDTYLIERLGLSDAPGDGMETLALSGHDGATVGYLVWTRPLPGWDALNELVAPVTLVLMLAGSGVLLASRYIIDTARRLERALIAARAADRSKSDFIAGLSHELRTPLNGVIGLAEVLLMGDTIKDGDRKMVDVIHRSGLTQLGLIDELLAVSSIEAGRRVLDTAPFDPADALREVGALARPAAQAKGLELDVTTPAGAPVLVLGDRHAFMQVCTNLIGNAVKFTDTGSVTASLSMTMRGGEAAMRLRVADTGPGIEAASHGAVFERFHQLDAGLARQASGAGLGLAITLSLVDLMEGAIRLESAPGDGAVFTVDLRLEIADAEQAELTAGPPITAERSAA